MADVERQAEQMPWGTADEVTRRIIDAAESAGANTVQVSLNRGVLPHEMFMEQIRRFAARGAPGTTGAQSRACAIGRGSPGLAERTQFHGDMRDPEIVKGRAGRFEPVASIKRHQMGLSGQHHRQTWILGAVK